jgi:hypothetical protein
MRTALSTAAGAIGAALVLTGACARRDLSRPATITSAPTTRDALTRAPESRLANELCLREAGCGRISRTSRYPSVETCATDVRQRVAVELDEDQCRPAVASRAFEACLSALRSAPCDLVIDRVDRVAACSPRAICEL